MRQMSPEVSASWISRLVFWWLNPLMLLGNLKILTQQDLYVVQVSVADGNSLLLPRPKLYSHLGKAHRQIIG